MAHHDHQPQSPTPRTRIDPAVQPVTGDHEDATSGSEGGGPRIGYSESDEAGSERYQFPNPGDDMRQTRTNAAPDRE